MTLIIRQIAAREDAMSVNDLVRLLLDEVLRNELHVELARRQHRRERNARADRGMIQVHRGVLSTTHE